MLDISCATVGYRNLGGKRTPVIQELSMQTKPGEIRAVLGRNGVGKTTLVRSIVGLLKPWAGEVRVFGLDPVENPTKVRSQLGVLLDGTRQLPERWNGQEVLIQAALLYGYDFAKSRSRAMELLSQMGLEDKARTPVSVYSRGMRQKLAIAVAMVGPAKLLVLDEPTLGMDPTAVNRVEQTLRSFAAGGGSVLLTSHALDFLDRLADQVTVLEAGRSVYEGTATGLVEWLGRQQRVRVHMQAISRSLSWPPGVVAGEGWLDCPLEPSILREVLEITEKAGLKVTRIVTTSGFEEFYQAAASSEVI